MGESPRGFESLTLRMIVKKSAQYHKYLARFLIFLLGTFGVTYYYTLFSSDITKHLIVFNVLLFFMFLLKNTKNWVILALGTCLLYFVLFTKIPSVECGTSTKYETVTSCECIGIKKYYFFQNQCIGKRTKCFNHSLGQINEVPCK